MTDRKEQQKHPYLYEKLHIRALLDPVTRRYLLLTAVLAILCLSVFIADLSFVPGLQRETAATQEKLLSLSKRHRDLIRQVDALGEDRIYTILEDFYTPAERRTLFSRVFAYELWINGRRHRKGSEYLRITCPELVIELKERQRIKDGIPAGLADRFRLLSTRPQESGEPDRLWRIDATIRKASMTCAGKTTA